MQHINQTAQNVVVQARSGSTPATFADAAAAPARRLTPVYLRGLDTTHHPKIATAVQRARDWAERKRDGEPDASLILAGPNGVGKTHIARAIWWSIRQTAVDHNGAAIPGTEQPVGRFYMANDLLAMMGTTRDEETGLVTVTRAGSVIGEAPLVVIDDLGAEQAIPFIKQDQQVPERQARLFKIVEHCYTLRISIIITTNLQIPELAAYVGPRSWDRLSVMAPRLPDGRSFIIDLFGVPSWRQQTAGR